MAGWSLDVNTYPVMVKANSRLVADSRKNRTRDAEEPRARDARVGGARRDIGFIIPAMGGWLRYFQR